MPSATQADADAGTTRKAGVTKERVFDRHQKVVAAVDLPHVPQGTPGQVLYVAGVTWFRYHVLFEGGQTVSSLDATQLADRRAWQQARADEALAARRAAAQVVHKPAQPTQ
jgi:hypothetical protein